MKGTINDSWLDEDGRLVTGENNENDVKGTAYNADIVVNLTTNVEELKKGLQEMNQENTRYYPNLQAAIRLANDSYSKNVNKLLISLYDGVPRIAIGVENSYGYGGIFSQYSTAEEAITAQHEDVASRTREEILSLEYNDVYFILLRPDDTSYDETWYNRTTGEFLLDFDGSPYVQEIYGTLENPTYGKMYSLNSDSLEEVVTEYIYEDIMEEVRVDIKSAVIYEYFSQDIIENFDITFSDESVDTTNLNDGNYIVWNIGDVQGNRTVNLQYTLKIKDMKNESLLNKVISISEKTELTYIDKLNEEVKEETTSSPRIQLTQIEQQEQTTPNVDNNEESDDTVAEGVLPQTGIRTVIGIIFGVFVLGIFILVKYRKLKDV